MTDYVGIKVGDEVELTMKGSGKLYKGVVCEVGRGDRGSYFPERAVWSKAWNKQKEDNFSSYINLDEVNTVVFTKKKNKIKIGTTYITPSGLKRVVVFADDKGALAENENGTPIWANHKLTGGWTEVLPEEWVCMYTRSDGRVMVTEIPLTTREKAESWALEHKVKVIQFVRIDENNKSSSV
jgi:hypothetical protein